MSKAEARPGVSGAGEVEAAARDFDVPMVPPATDVGGHDVLSEADAARLTHQIQLKLETIADGVESVLPLIEQARAGDAHQVLGYPSWTAYFADKFGGTLPRLRKVERVPLVELLAEQGMSTRAIAPVVGASKSTVADDLAGAGVQNRTPAEPADRGASDDELGHGVDDDQDHGADAVDDAGGLVDSPMATATEAANAAVKANGDLPPEHVEQKITTATRNVTGIDGKTYSVPPPANPASKPRRRRPLPDAYRTAVWELDKAVQRLVRLHEDDRFLGHREQLTNGRIASLNELLFDIERDLDGHHRCHDCEQRLPIRGDYITKCDECEADR